jgi:light-regulated signal transduction histidine kinase (bacteriophytochrome)
MVGLKGAQRWLETHAVPFRPQPEGDTCLLAVTRDITERKQAEAELTRHREHLEELVAARTAALQAANTDLEAFSYSVSHDLRAPLRAIAGYAHILIEDCAQALGQEGQRMLEVISHQTGRMGQLIDDLLAFSRMGRQPMQTTDIDMDALAQEAFHEQSALNPKRAVEFKLSPLPPARGDRAMLRVVLNNLLSNAIKYTRGRASPQIEIGSAAPGALNVYIVKDNGVGFDMQHAGKLFGVFQRLHSSEEFEGTGVGLALVQQIIRRHGGQVWAEAKPNEGATFFFSLPRQHAAPPVYHRSAP